MHVYGPAHLHGPQAVNTPHVSRTQQAATPMESSPIRDEVSISDAARLIAKVHEAPDIRQDRVTAIRAQIAAGTYETPERLGGAVARLLDEIG